jgi:DNA-binding transcriptional ArsR family regulator
MPMDDLVDFYKAMGDETRLNLVALLAAQSPGTAMCVGRLAGELGTSISNISQHLKVLRDCGLVYSERRRYRIHYFLDRSRFEHYAALMEHLLGADMQVEAILERRGHA